MSCKVLKTFTSMSCSVVNEDFGYNRGTSVLFRPNKLKTWIVEACLVHL